MLWMAMLSAKRLSTDKRPLWALQVVPAISGGPARRAVPGRFPEVQVSAVCFPGAYRRVPSCCRNGAALFPIFLPVKTFGETHLCFPAF